MPISLEFLSDGVYISMNSYTNLQFIYLSAYAGLHVFFYKKR